MIGARVVGYAETDDRRSDGAIEMDMIGARVVGYAEMDEKCPHVGSAS